MIKPVGYAYIGDLSRIEEGIFDTIAITSSYDAGGCTVPLFTLDQVREIAQQAYIDCIYRRVGDTWDQSKTKSELDKLAAQAAGDKLC